MSTQFNFLMLRPGLRLNPSIAPLLLSVIALLAAGCGGNGSGASFRGNSNVVLLASSTANGDLTDFNLTIKSLTLTNEAGKQVSVLASPTGEEFIHLNGPVEPIATVTVPQGVYTSATATYGSNYVACAGQTTGDDFRDQMPAETSSTINLPHPITVTGTAMGLDLNLEITPIPGACPTPTLYQAGPATVESAFSLTPVQFAAQPTNSTNGLAAGLQGLVSAVNPDGSGMTVSSLVNRVEVSNPPNWQVSFNSGTVFQGISGSSQLKVDLPVNMDLAIQPDGTLVATRVEVLSTDTTTLTLASGTLINVYNSPPVSFVDGSSQEGYLPLGEGGFGSVNFANAQFQISGQFGNLGTLPFTPSFNAANMVAGQRVTVTTQATAIAGGPTYVAATTLTLMPQTINGTVSAISTTGNFTTYTVELAAYDLFPQFAVQPGQTSLLTDPSTVVVYAGSNTQMLNSGPIRVGGLFRFYGLVLNNNGALRMDCTQIDDGVQE